jgi:hypothetical protein
LVWFVVALFTGNAINLPSKRSLSITIRLQRENIFSLFSLQASKPIFHKAFPRLNARETIGKNFAAILKSGNQSTGKAKGKERTWYVQVPKQRRKGLKEKEWMGRNRMEGKGRNQSRLLKTYCHSPLNIPNKRQPLLCFARCFPFKVLPSEE